MTPVTIQELQRRIDALKSSLDAIGTYRGIDMDRARAESEFQIAAYGMAVKWMEQQQGKEVE